MFKIGYIDEDKGWRNTFYQFFKNDFEIISFDINQDTKFENLIIEVENQKLDALIVDFLLDESGLVNFKGNKIVEKVLSKRPHFPILVYTSHEPDAITDMENVNIINEKDERPEKVEVLKSKILSLINNYNLKVVKSECRVEELTSKRNKEPLTLLEEEELSKLYIYLDEIYPDEKTIPANLLHNESITRLNEFVQQTSEILEQLKTDLKCLHLENIHPKGEIF